MIYITVPHHPHKGFKGEVKKKLKIKCNCRKPNSGMIDEAIKKKYNINRKRLDIYR